ncbi:MAG: ABC transporter ATP-binding protein [Pseudomonadota bacterium]
MKRVAIFPLKSLKNFMSLKGYFIKNKWALAAGLFSLLLVDLLQLWIPLIIKRVIDALTQKTASAHLLIQYGLIIMLIALVIALFRYLWRYFLFGHSRKVEEALRNRLYSHLQTLSISFYLRTKTGDLMARAINDLNAVRMATGMGLVALTDGLVMGVAAIGFMVTIDLRLTLISLIPAPLIIILTRVLTRRMSSGYEKVQRTFSDLTERVREAFAGIRVVKAYTGESWEYKKVEDEGRKYISENMQLARTIGFFFPLMAIFNNLGMAIVIFWGGRLAILGHISTGDFVAFIGYLNLLAWPMMAMGWVTNLIQRGSVSMRRINHILEEIPEMADKVDSKEPSKIRGDISLRGLRFTYPDTKRAVLEDVTLHIEAGMTVAFVGRVGSGKTTLLYTIPRLLNVPAGMVFVDGVDISLMPLKKLRENIGFVTQETILFSATIRDNVLFGRNDIHEERLIPALRMAHIYDEILTFQRRLDTLVGEKGITLSGGQRQRLTIARALLSDPQILIMDDALSMVDTRTEEEILNGILESRKGKTTLIVSHRISTIQRADLIVVLDRGRLIETGDHGRLMRSGQEYARIYERQILAQELELGD